jgi:hypothetical protein
MAIFSPVETWEEIMWWLPGWDSIASAGWWSHFWFWFGIACLVALAASEVVSHVYSLRKDDLVAAGERTAEQQRKNDSDAAEGRRRADVEAVQKKLSEADRKLAELEPRRISPAQQGELIQALSPFAGQIVRLRAVNNKEPKDLTADFVSILREAKWVHPEAISYMMIAGPEPVGVQVSVNPQDANNQSAIAPPVGTLVSALVRMGLMPAPQVVADAGAPVGTILVTIGVKPPPPAR